MQIVDHVFSSLRPECLLQITNYLRWDPVISDSPFAVLSQSETDKRIAWLDRHRAELEDEVCAVGSHTFGRRRPYLEIVRDLAQKLQVGYAPTDVTPDVEVKIIQKVCQDAWEKLSPAERVKFQVEVEKLAAQYAKGAKGAAVGFAALTTAQLSGFGVYALASSLFGGLGLSFGFFTGLSTFISWVIGPLGWIGMGLVAVGKLGAPNYKKLLPVIVLIGLERQGGNSPTLLPGKPPQFSLPSAKTTRAAPPSIPARTNLELSEVEYDEIAMKLGLGPYCSLNREDQEVVRKLHAESALIERPTNNIAFFEAAKTITTVTAAPASSPQPAKTRPQVTVIRKGDAASKPPEKRVEALRRQLSNYMKHLDFTDAAIEALLRMDERDRRSFESKLGEMNIGQVKVKDEVHGTNPKVYEGEVGHDGRIYFRQNGGDRYLIELIGSKGSQKRDIRFLRRRRAA